MNREIYEIYLRSDVIERDGMAFLSCCFSEDEYQKTRIRAANNELLQISINHIHLWRIEEEFAKGFEIAITLQNEWMKKLQVKFPTKTKIIRLVNIDGKEWRLEMFIN